MSAPILVLGAGGFLGRHIVERLATGGHDVVAATRTPASFSHARVRNVVAPFDDVAHFRAVVPDCGAVVHAASSSTPGSTAAQPQLEGNLRTTLALLESMQDSPRCRLVYLSSGGTLYGDRQDAVDETALLLPRSYHGAGKAAAEHFIHAWAVQYGGTAVSLRPSNVYGPGQLPRRGFGIVPAALDAALSGQPLRIWGDGSTVRDYLFVDDFVALCVAALSRPLPGGAHVYNAASGEALSLSRLLDHIETVTGRPLQRVHGPARGVDVHTITMDNRAAAAALGWKPAVTVADGLERTWNWFCSRQ